MFTIEYAKNLKWNDAAHATFDCVVKYREFIEELPATVDVADLYDHIQILWSRGVAGEFGSIAEYVPPPMTSNQGNG